MEQVEIVSSSRGVIRKLGACVLVALLLFGMHSCYQTSVYKALTEDFMKHHVAFRVNPNDGRSDFLMSDLQLNCEPNTRVVITPEDVAGCYNMGDGGINVKVNGKLTFYGRDSVTPVREFRNTKFVVHEEFEKKFEDFKEWNRTTAIPLIR